MKIPPTLINSKNVEEPSPGLEALGEGLLVLTVLREYFRTAMSDNIAVDHLFRKLLPSYKSFPLITTNQPTNSFLYDCLSSSS